jgi:hypothetical protein
VLEINAQTRSYFRSQVLVSEEHYTDNVLLLVTSVDIKVKLTSYTILYNNVQERKKKESKRKKRMFKEERTVDPVLNSEKCASTPDIWRSQIDLTQNNVVFNPL